MVPNSMGHSIQYDNDNVAFTDDKIKRSSQEDLKPGVKIERKTVQVDPEVLFLRCVAAAQGFNEDAEPYFITYELCAVPTTLFHGNFMRHVKKSELTNYYITKDCCRRRMVHKLD